MTIAAEEGMKAEKTGIMISKIRGGINPDNSCQAWKAVEEFLYDTYEKGLWIMSYGIRIKKDKNCI